LAKITPINKIFPLGFYLNRWENGKDNSSSEESKNHEKSYPFFSKFLNSIS
jgi:hypothetical protein